MVPTRSSPSPKAIFLVLLSPAGLQGVRTPEGVLQLPDMPPTLLGPYCSKLTVLSLNELMCRMGLWKSS